MKAELTAERVRSLLTYDPATGVFTWRVTRTFTARAGSVAGRRRPDGRWELKIEGRWHQAHRVAWLWVTGQWPAGEIDHRSTDHTDNRWSNLREATTAQNGKNVGRIRSSSGFKGVTLHKSGKYQASIKSDGRAKYLGLFDDPQAAADAYDAACLVLHGEFAMTNAMIAANYTDAQAFRRAA